jgi:hypothetical protein
MKRMKRKKPSKKKLFSILYLILLRISNKKNLKKDKITKVFYVLISKLEHVRKEISANILTI